MKPGDLLLIKSGSYVTNERYSQGIILTEPNLYQNTVYVVWGDGKIIKEKINDNLGVHYERITYDSR